MCLVGLFGLQLTSSSNQLFSIDTVVPSEVFERFYSEFASCRGLPSQILEELKESGHNLFLGGRYSWSEDSNEITATTLILQNRNICHWSECRTHFFKGDPRKDTCEYAFTIQAYKGIGFTGSFLFANDQIYKPSCNVYFNGSCFTGDTTPWYRRYFY
ncbi:hypothetical protein [Labrenzia sp. VG12]|uniref:hypothetical protein n=1 Tax=Labrenzia sp. VG12 TaxID=2021862 RepID=UPI000B8BC7FF|nr:hypothetical protein [Labrenzia sp. VG12]ASP36400.1 hypothetical protein CHH27_26745 [Labrenzia sp. VG12]